MKQRDITRGKLMGLIHRFRHEETPVGSPEVVQLAHELEVTIAQLEIDVEAEVRNGGQG